MPPGATPVDLPPVPVVQPADEVLADLCLAADGLLAHPHPVGGPVPGPAGNTVRVDVDGMTGAQALTAGSLVVADAESAPVVTLRVTGHQPVAVPEAAAEGAADPDRLVLVGTATPSDRVPTGVGQDQRLAYRATRPARVDTVVVLERPLLAAEETLLRDRPGVLLVVPVARATADGLPAATLLRTARASAHRIGAELVTATVWWRGDASDAQLAEQVRSGLAAGTLVHLRPARAEPNSDWAQVLTALDVGTDPETGPVAARLVPDGSWQELRAWRPDRRHRGLVVFFTGLSGAGKSTLARMLTDHVESGGERTVSLLDGDEVRRLLSAGLGFDAAGRDLNIRRIGWVAAQIARHAGMAVCAPIAPYEATREAVRAMVEEVGDFVLVHVATSLQTCEDRDVKGLYARARAGHLTGFTGIDDPYEPPVHPQLRVDTTGQEPRDSLEIVLTYLREQGWLTT